MPAVCDETRLQLRGGHYLQHFVKLRMQRRLTAREVNVRDLCRFARLVDHAAQQRERKELGVMAVEIVRGAKAVAAMKITDVGQLHTQTMWAIVVVDVAISLHCSRVTGSAR